MLGRPLKIERVEKLLPVYKDFCEWVSKGHVRHAWYYKHYDLKLSYKTLQKYLKIYEKEIDFVDLEIAEAMSRQFWEEEGNKLMRGDYKFGSANVWKLQMQNRFSKSQGWSSEDKENMEIIQGQFDYLKSKFESILPHLSVDENPPRDVVVEGGN